MSLESDNTDGKYESPEGINGYDTLDRESDNDDNDEPIESQNFDKKLIEQSREEEAAIVSDPEVLEVYGDEETDQSESSLSEDDTLSVPESSPVAPPITSKVRIDFVVERKSIAFDFSLPEVSVVVDTESKPWIITMNYYQHLPFARSNTLNQNYEWDEYRYDKL